jgi:hypothetical protein
MRSKFILSTVISALVIFLPSVFAQSSAAEEHRIMEPITVNGQQAMGVLVVLNGTAQGSSCDSPKPYVAANGSESGWACLEQATGMWLLHAQPPSYPADAASAQSPTVIYGEPNTVYVPSYDYGYGYPYPSYPYSYYGYPNFWGPQLGLGFAFGFGHNGHVFRDGHGFAHGGFNHGGGFGHMGGSFGRGGGFRGGGGFGGHMGGGHMGGGHMGGGHMGGGHMGGGHMGGGHMGGGHMGGGHR